MSVRNLLCDVILFCWYMWPNVAICDTVQPTQFGPSAEPVLVPNFRFVGFGYGVADVPISCSVGDPNPPFSSAIVNWVDFRFYGSAPGFPTFRGTLNRDRNSFVGLNALTPDGLFPASLTNNLYLSLSPVGFPAVEYKNTEAMQVFAPSTPRAPPPPGVVGTQVHPLDTFEAATPIPGGPSAVSFAGGVQEFLPPDGIPMTGSQMVMGLWTFQVSNPFDKAIRIAYFAHLTGSDPLLLEQFDGLVGIAALGQGEFIVDLRNVPLTGDETIYVDSIILDPFDVQGAARLIISDGHIQIASPGCEPGCTTSAWQKSDKPEPATMVLFGSGMVGLWGLGLMRRRASGSAHANRVPERRKANRTAVYR